MEKLFSHIIYNLLKLPSTFRWHLTDCQFYLAIVFRYYDHRVIDIHMMEAHMRKFHASPWSGPRDTWLRLTAIGRTNVSWAIDPRANIIALFYHTHL